MSARSEEIEEEADYVNAATHTVKKTGTTSDQKFPSFTKSLPPLVVCWGTLLIFTSLRIYCTFVMSENNNKLIVENQQLKTLMQRLNEQVTMISHNSERKQLKENITSLLAVNQNLTNLNHKLRSENEKLWQDHNNLTVQISNLTQDYCVLESKIANVTEENQNLKTQNQNLTTKNQQWKAQNEKLKTRNKKLKTQNQELETQKKNLTGTIQDMETQQNELNISRAQWSIDAYCPRKKDISERKCEPCQKDWLPFQSSCFVVINPASTKDWKTWDEAREVCKGKFSDLAVIVNQDEKKFINDHSWKSSGTNGYWIGLRAEDEKWKWVDGTDLNENSWIQQHPPTDGHCAISVQNQGWKSVNCTDTKMWICEKAALSV